MSFQMTLGLTLNAISSAGSGDGHSPSGLQDGPTIAPCGQVVAPANLSARQAKEAGLLTSGTYGQRSFGSSASVALRQSLASKLHQRMDLDGGILFRLTWKERVTPAGQTIYALRASGRSTSGNDSTGWQTPTVQDGNGRDRHNQRGGGITLSLLGESRLAPWPTPNTMDTIDREHMRPSRAATGRQTGYLSEAIADYAAPASWMTPTAATGGKNRGSSAGNDLRNQCKLAHGTTPSGSPAPTEKRGQLNPAFSRWLQGYPVEWDIAAILAHRQRKTRQKGG
jgi:hypothetical protein